MFSRATQSLTLLYVLVRQTTDNGVILYTSPLLSAIGVTHGFTTRMSGVSPSPFDSLNLGNPPGDLCDDPGNLEVNLGRLHAALRLASRRRIWVQQVHGNRVTLTSDRSFENGSKADAIVSSDASAYLLIRVADCVPILLSTPDGKTVAAIHAGWRGVVAGVVLEAVKALTAVSHVPSDELIAAIGPCISREHFEVGPEVVEEFERLFGGNALWAQRHVDLPAAVAAQLLNSRISISKIDRTDRCTFRDRGEFFSHRRDRGITGRMAAVIAPIDS